MLYLKNQRVKIGINPLGAELQELTHVEHGNLLWKKDDGLWNRFAPILFPIVGRLVNDQYTLEGEVYTMRQHGFARDQVFEVLEYNETSATLCIKANEDTRAQYPYEFEYTPLLLDNSYTLAPIRDSPVLPSERTPLIV